VERSANDTWPLFILSPRDKSQQCGTLLWIHGGGHVSELHPTHWDFLSWLVAATGWSALLPVFPLAPSASHRDVYPTLERLYTAGLTGQVVSAVVGDSSGGGLALGLVQALPEKQRPEHTILLSPWLDAVLDNPRIEAIQPMDPFNTSEGLRRLAGMFAGGDDLATPRLSPLRGPLDHLGHITVFVGTRDILTPDAYVLRSKAGPGTTVDVREYDETHAWMLLSPRSRAEIVKQVSAALVGES
jgi:acetyl esterase/lipase